MSKLPQFSFGLVCLALLGGCDTAPSMRYDKVDLVEASGTVMLDGEPLPNAVVTFEAEDGQFSYGLTDSGGEYQLQLDTVMQGVVPGKKTVRISTTRKVFGLNSDEEAGEGGGEEGAPRGAPPAELVPEKYNKNSELTVEVTPDRTEYNFELTSK